MWLCLRDAFCSIVVDKDSPDRLMIRARRKKDLINVVGPDAEILDTPDRDYRWRTFIGRDQFKALMIGRIDLINYTNFKDSVKDGDLHRMYMDFWTRHKQYQSRDRSSHFAWGPGDVVHHGRRPRKRAG